MTDQIKLHLGCGKVILPEWINVDHQYFPGVDVVENVQYLRSFRNKNVSTIYACHVLEHFKRWEVHDVLQLWYDVLSPGGEMFISVPDFDAIVEYYKYFGLNDLIGLLYGGQDYPSNFHYYIWNFSSLKEDLKRVGFEEIQRFEVEDGPNPDIDDFSKAYLPHMNKDGMLMSLNVKCKKPK